MKDASFDTKPSKIPRHGDADVPARTVSFDQHLKDQNLRLSTSGRSNHDNGYTTRVKEPTRHGTVELGRGQILALGNVVDAIDKG
jgi:hypothetical protein